VCDTPITQCERDFYNTCNGEPSSSSKSSSIKPSGVIAPDPNGCSFSSLANSKRECWNYTSENNRVTHMGIYQ